jgi:ribosome biogenesis GTPase
LSDTGLILVSYGTGGLAELADGRRVECSYRRSIGRPFCGDRVAIEDADGNTRVVSEILPRKNVFVRAGNRQQKQVVAANLDQVLIVIAPAPEPNRDLVERYLVAVHSLGIEPLIVVNKAELLGEQGEGPLARLGEYSELGYGVVETSCKGAPGIDALIPLLENQTSILVGQSGVGKSSLVNALLPDHDLQTGELSRATGKGTHTTTTTIMYTLPCSGRLIDSPGVWEYGLWEMDENELAAGFPEIRSRAGGCRFNDCKHGSEPDCSVRQAVESGEIREWRYQSYLRLLEQGS